MKAMALEWNNLIKILEFKNNELLDLYRDYIQADAMIETTIAMYRKECQNNEKLQNGKWKYLMIKNL